MIDKHLKNIASTDDSDLYEKSITAVNSIRAEHSKDTNIVNEINYKFSPEEIELAFNPSILSDSEFDSLSDKEKRKFLKIVTMYYEIELPSTISQVDIDESYYTRRSAYRIERNLSENTNILYEEVEEDGVEEKENTKLEILISQKKEEFLHRNVEIAAGMLGFNFQEFLEICEKRAKNEEQKDRCANFFEKIFNELLTFIKREFVNLSDNLQWHYHKSYENALPIKHAMTYFDSLDMFDEILFELNPSEFKKIMQAVEDIRQMDEEKSQFKNWYDYYRHTIRQSK